MDKQVEIKRIVIRIGDKEASLTLEDAKALRDVLDTMFGETKQEQIVVYPKYVPYVFPWNWEPATTPRKWHDWTITCNAQHNVVLTTNAKSQSLMAEA